MGEVHVTIHRRGPLVFWHVMYDDVFLFFDRAGMAFSMNKALRGAERAVLRVIRYENKKEKN